MDYVKLVYAILLLVGGLVIFVLPMLRNKDERKAFISGKAQSYAFLVVIGMLLLEVGQMIYFMFQNSEANAGGISPLVFLSVILVIYAGTSLVYRNKYGG